MPSSSCQSSFPPFGLGGLFLFLTAFSVFNAVAQTADSVRETPEPPPFLSARPPIPELLLKDKKEGWYFTGLPAIGVDPEEGYSGGAILQIYDNGSRDSSLFHYTPYEQLLSVGAIVSTEGREVYFASYDLPYFRESPWRFRAYLGYDGNETENYFGTGEATLGALKYPGSTRTFQDFDEYRRALDTVVDGKTWERYNFYERHQWMGAGTIEYDFLGGMLRPGIGLQVMHLNFVDYTGIQTDGATIQETKLMEDQRLGRIEGFEGGWDNRIRMGLTYDSRDYEPDPTRGILAQVLGTANLKALGSDLNHGQVTLGYSQFISLFPEHTRLVLAGNAVYAVRFGDVPFYSQSSLALPQDENRSGLGGFKSMRGYSRNRFVGDVTAGAALELRWSFAETTFWKQHLGFSLVPFIETGRVFDDVGSTTLKGWKVSGGGGMRLAWNLATVISFDYGVSREGELFFMEIGHQF